MDFVLVTSIVFGAGLTHASDTLTIRVLWYDDQGVQSGSGLNKTVTVTRSAPYADFMNALKQAFPVPQERTIFSLITGGNKMAVVDPKAYTSCDLRRFPFIYFITE